MGDPSLIGIVGLVDRETWGTQIYFSRSCDVFIGGLRILYSLMYGCLNHTDVILFCEENQFLLTNAINTNTIAEVAAVPSDIVGGKG